MFKLSILNSEACQGGCREGIKYLLRQHFLIQHLSPSKASPNGCVLRFLKVAVFFYGLAAEGTDMALVSEIFDARGEVFKWVVGFWCSSYKSDVNNLDSRRSQFSHRMSQRNETSMWKSCRPPPAPFAAYSDIVSLFLLNLCLKIVL